MKRPDPQRAPLLSENWRNACVALNVLPIPGVGAIIAGWRNPHSKLLGKGVAQLVLVVFGSFPLIVPGVIGFVWAASTSYWLHTNTMPIPKRGPPRAEL